ncbi:O-antigen ligase family protein [Aurantimicrobium minutum]|uniref:O-antigen ligase family protein n=1 Tax=Aurantimicrobium minutum TaxID=708131 RepID=UPI002476A9A7|nr:O-antigen ligase family protein [Aurantimicrobium minutum]MDH6208369.1 exopolysaccharide production protein ExoQ [Aurantimicrobium minutum]
METLTKLAQNELFQALFVSLLLIVYSMQEWLLVTKYLDLSPVILTILVCVIVSALPENNWKVNSFAPVPLIAMFAFAFLSLFWSQIPSNSLQSIITFALILFQAILITVNFNTRSMVFGFVLSGLIAGLISALMAIQNPDMYFSSGFLNGFYEVRSPLAFLLVFSLAASLSITFKFKYPVLIVLGVLIYLTGSSTAFVSVIFVVATISVFQLLRKISSLTKTKQLLVWTFLSGFFLFCISLSSIYLSELLGVFGKGVTFSGRTKIWELVSETVKQSPLIGFGWGNENIWSLSSDTGYSIALQWFYIQKLESLSRLAHAHSAFWEIFLYLGFVGLFILLWIFISMFFAAIYGLFEKSYRTQDHNSEFFLFVLCSTVVLISYSFTEPYFLFAIGIFITGITATIPILIRKKMQKQASQLVSTDK